jgi:hypothetical protein
MESRQSPVQDDDVLFKSEVNANQRKKSRELRCRQSKRWTRFQQVKQNSIDNKLPSPYIAKAEDSPSRHVQ